MRRCRRRKIEVPNGDTQPQFELGDTAEDIERRRRKQEEREGRENEERDRQREREMEEEEGKRRERQQIQILMQNQLNPDRRRAR